MTLQRTPGAFRITPGAGSINLYDVVTPLANYESIRSPGATQIETIAGSPAMAQHWQLQTLSIQGYLGLLVSTGAPMMFGSLGKIIAGLLPAAQDPQPTAGVVNDPPAPGIPFNPTLLPLPNDLSLVSTLWDPLLDPLPPIIGGLAGADPINALLPISTVIAPTNIVELVAGQQLGVGVWILPSLIGNATRTQLGLVIEQMSFTLAYDDGL